MSVSSINSGLLATLLGSSGSTLSSSSIGSELLAAVEQGGSGSSDGLASAIVSLSAQSGSSDSSTTTYNAQGLLSQMQVSTLLSDPLLQSDSSDASGASSSMDSILQEALSLSSASVSTGSASSSSTQATDTSASSSGSSTTGGSTDLNSNWTQVLKQNPALAGQLVQSEVDQSLLGSIG